MRLLSHLNFIWSCVFKQIALLFLCVSVTHAHNLPSGMGTINVNKDKAFVVLSLPVSLFKSADDNADGKLSQTELQHHQVAIHNIIQQGFSFYNINAKNNTAKNQKATNTPQPQQMKTVAISLIDDSPNHSHSHNNQSNSHSHQGHNHGKHEHATGVNTSATINYLGVVSFPTPINQLRVTSKLFDPAPENYKFELYAKRSNQSSDSVSKPKREKMLISPNQQDVMFFANKAFVYKSRAINTPESPTNSNKAKTEQNKNTNNQYIWLILLVLLGLEIIIFAFVIKKNR